MRIAAAVAVLALVVGQVGAHEQGAGSIPESGTEPGPVEQVRIGKLGMVPYQRLFEAISEQGESLDAFVVRIAPRFRAYSDQTGFEACGAIAQTSAGGYSIIVGTNHSHIGCAVLHDKIPAGSTFIRQGVHSHGTDKPVRPTKADLVFFGPMLSQYGIGPNTRRPLMKIGGQGVNDFSEADLNGLDGYLAGEAKVFHHASGAVREVSGP